MNDGVVTRRTIVNGIELSFGEVGQGPLVMLCHGWPETAYSWRHQMRPLAAAGHRVVAPDMRGFGASSSPDDVDQFTLLHLVGDLVGLMDALEEETAVVVGHDWGAIVAWTAALLRRDRFRGVAGLSVPYAPRGPSSATQRLRQAGRTDSYLLYFQEPGIAEAELERDVAASLRRIYHSASGDAGPGPWTMSAPPGSGLLEGTSVPATQPEWLSEDDLSIFADAFRASGFRGGLNWYRNIDRNWALLAPWNGCPIRQPSLYVVGTRDNVLASMPRPALEQLLGTALPGLTAKVFVDGAGHWVQQERPDEVSAALLEFLRALPN